MTASTRRPRVDYDRDGYARLGAVVDPDVIDALAVEAATLHELLSTRVEMPRHLVDVTLRPHRIHRADLVSEPVRVLLHDTALAAVTASCLGAYRAEPVGACLVRLPPNSPGTLTAPLGGREPDAATADEHVHLWVPLQPADGVLRVEVGSHHTGRGGRRGRWWRRWLRLRQPTIGCGTWNGTGLAVHPRLFAGESANPTRAFAMSLVLTYRGAGR